MTLSRKILLGFSTGTLVLLIVAVLSFKNSEKLLESNRWVAHTHEVLYELEQILLTSVDVETGARGFVITKDENYLEPFNKAKSDLFEHIKKARELTKDNPVQLQNIDIIEKLAIRHIARQSKKIELRRSSFDLARAMVMTGESKQLEDEIRNTVNNAKNIEQQLLAEREKATEEDTRNFNIIFIVLLVIIIAVLIGVYFIISINLKALRKAEQETADKNWTLAGSGELVKNMQGNKQVMDLAETIITHLATYLDAQLGAVYISGENRRDLELAAAYAAGKKKRNSVNIQFGEGVVGQAAAENRTILFSDIPADYFSLDTGFGSVKPKNIIVIPFVFEGMVIGIIELGSIHQFTNLQQQYLRLVCDSVAIAIASSQNREKTKELLEETQRQAEELEMQQEELKQANEELTLKTDLLERSESELKTQQEELQQTNEELEVKATLLEEQKNELQAAKTEIEQKAKEIEVTSKYKSEFLANMSHELRTPLNSILISSQLLSQNKHKTLGDKEIEFSKHIYNSGNDLLNLINEILDLSKVESGKMELEIGETTFQSVAANMSALFSEMAKSRAIEFAISIDEKQVPPGILTDRQRLEQILKNLLSNAFKFTENGGEITLSIAKPAGNTKFKNKNLDTVADVVAITVHDTGIGIPVDKQAIIFEAFQQADGSTKRKYGGTGLGLSISRELAAVLGGEIQLESSEGKGSTFSLFLPVQFDKAYITSDSRLVEVKENEPLYTKEIRKPARPEISEADVNDDRNAIGENDKVILIVEDDEKFASVLLDLIRERNYKGIIAHQGGTGLSFARHYRPAAILLDIHLPVMDGTEVLKQIKNDPELRHIPIQIISAFDHRKESISLGAFDYIRKPVTTGSLQSAFDKIENFISKKLKKLLIVEDNKQQNDAISELIGNGDVKCFAAYSGAQARDMLEADHFDCVIVDLGLPDMPGFELLELIRSNEKLNRIPVIVYTGRDLTREENNILTKLADTVVLKTVDSQERLLDETVLFLHRMETKLPKEKQNIIRKLHKTGEVLKDKTILLVDDDIRNIYSLSSALEDEGLHCVVAENGKVALEVLKNNPSIDLVLMDIMMPEMDGFEATIEIRKMSQYDKLPVIALTAKAMKGDKEKCLAVGMSDYISKPVNIDQLFSLMRVWLYK